MRKEDVSRADQQTLSNWIEKLWKDIPAEEKTGFVGFGKSLPAIGH